MWLTRKNFKSLTIESAGETLYIAGKDKTATNIWERSILM